MLSIPNEKAMQKEIQKCITFFGPKQVNTQQKHNKKQTQIYLPQPGIETGLERCL